MSFALLLLFLFTLYASPALLMPSLDAVRPAQIAGAGAAAVLAVRKVMSNEGWRFARPESYLVLAVLVAGAFSSLDAFWPRLAAETTLNFLKITIVYFLIVNCVDTDKRLHYAAVALVVGGFVPAVGTLWNFFTGNLVEGSRAGFVGNFANPNDLSFSLVLLVPLAFCVMRNSSLLLRPLILLILGAYFAAIFAAQSRGGFVGLMTVLAVLGLRSRNASARMVAAGGVGAAVLFATVYWSRDVGFADLNTDFTLHQRVETIRTGLRMFADYPLLGVGLGCSVVAWPLYASTGVSYSTALVTHNTMIQALSELGLAGFIPLAALLLMALVHVRRAARNTAVANPLLSEYAVALEASLWGFLVCGLSGGYLVSWFPYVIIGLISALTLLGKSSGGPHGVSS